MTDNDSTTNERGTDVFRTAAHNCEICHRPIHTIFPRPADWPIICDTCSTRVWRALFSLAKEQLEKGEV